MIEWYLSRKHRQNETERSETFLTIPVDDITGCYRQPALDLGHSETAMTIFSCIQHDVSQISTLTFSHKIVSRSSCKYLRYNYRGYGQLSFVSRLLAATSEWILQDHITARNWTRRKFVRKFRLKLNPFTALSCSTCTLFMIIIRGSCYTARNFADYFFPRNRAAQRAQARFNFAQNSPTRGLHAAQGFVKFY